MRGRRGRPGVSCIVYRRDDIGNWHFFGISRSKEGAHRMARDLSKAGECRTFIRENRAGYKNVAAYENGRRLRVG